MKADEAQKKIWLGKYTQNLMLSDPNSNTYVEYVRKDTFVEKTEKWIKEHTSLSEKLVIENFRKYMEGE